MRVDLRYGSFRHDGMVPHRPRVGCETGLYYYRARYYDPTVGRFISEDPIGFGGGINFYAYVRNDPVILTDPLGRTMCIKRLL